MLLIQLRVYIVVVIFRVEAIEDFGRPYKYLAMGGVV
jgi:hypothetical protein